MLEIELKKQGKISRLTNKTFQFDPKLKEGFYSANYFLKSQKIVKENEPNHIVTMQWFQRRDDSMLCGVDEAIALIHTFAIHPEELEIEALNDRRSPSNRWFWACSFPGVKCGSGSRSASTPDSTRE